MHLLAKSSKRVLNTNIPQKENGKHRVLLTPCVSTLLTYVSHRHDMCAPTRGHLPLESPACFCDTNVLPSGVYFNTILQQLH